MLASIPHDSCFCWYIYYLFNIMNGKGRIVALVVIVVVVGLGNSTSDRGRRERERERVEKEGIDKKS